jgi:hypothetical protein
MSGMVKEKKWARSWGTWIEVREGTGWEDRRRKENSHGTEKSERFNPRV